MSQIVHHPDYTIAANAAERFPWDKYAQVIAQMRAADPGTFREYAPALMPEEWLSRVHSASYVDSVLKARVPPEIERRIGFAVTPTLSRRAQRTCGGTWMAAQLALSNGFAANTAGGSHHALHDSGAGYCIFNDLAVAAHRLLAEGDVRHILVIDLDVHQGDGTAMLMAGREEVTTFSMHAQRNFPARKAQSTLDIGLPDGCDDDQYLSVLQQNLPALITDHHPDLILYQAGVDVHRDDKLGRLGLTNAGLIARDQAVAQFARSRGIPLASVLGGGYGDDVSAVAARHAASIRTLASAFSR